MITIEAPAAVEALRTFEQNLTAAREAMAALAGSADAIDGLTPEEFPDWSLKLWIVQSAHGMLAGIRHVDADIQRLQTVIAEHLPEVEPDGV